MKRNLIFILAFITVWSAGAQQTQTLELDIHDAIEIALNDNPTILIANLEIERYDYVRKEVIGNHLPQLSTSGSYTRNILKQKLGGSISISGDNMLSAGADLTVPLFVPAVYSNLRLTREQMSQAVEAARGTRIDLVAEVKKTYYNILLAEKSLEVLFASQSNIQQTVDDTRNLFENGLASEYDLLTAQVQLSNLAPTIMQTENAISVAYMMLKMYLSIPEEIDISLRGDLDQYSEYILSSGLEFTTDISENSDLLSLDWQERILEEQRRLIGTQRMPTVAGFGNFTISGDDFDRSAFAGMTGGDPGSSSSSKFLWQKPLAVGVSISIPIFSGLTNVNKQRQISNNISQLRLQREYLEESTMVQVNSSINNVMTAKEQMKANKITIDQATKAYDISRTRFDAGMGTMLEVNSSELAKTQAQLNYTQSVYDYLAAMADYVKIIGREDY